MASGSSFRVLVHGHRGARAVFPDNTLAGFRYAIDAGADAIELDLAVTKDSLLVVSHDPVLADRRAIRELTLAQLGGRIPTLDQVFRLSSRGRFDFNVEVKSFPRRPRYTPPPEECARLVLEAVRAHQLAARVMVQSFDYRVLRVMKRLAPEIRLSALLKPGLRGFVRVARRAGAGIVGPYHRLATRRRVVSAHAAGIQVIPWTANTPRSWARLVRAGVDGIITDDPAGLIQFLEGRGLR